MNFNTAEKPPITIESVSLRETLITQGDTFLGEEKKYINPEVFEKIIGDTEKELLDKTNDGKTDVGYLKNKFKIGTTENLTIGDIVSARRWGIDINPTEKTIESGQEKKLRKLINEKKSESIVYKHLNKELAEKLSEVYSKKDIFISSAYKKISERTGTESKQLGVVAEQIIIGVLERIAIDRSDLGLSVIEANAYQDVNNKIDFILATKHKKRGVGVNREDKSIGVQFTTNIPKGEHKMEQIAKAKERGVDVDDIVYVAIDQKELAGAIHTWEKDNKPISGPWKFLPSKIREQVTKNLFTGLLEEEQKKRLAEDESH